MPKRYTVEEFAVLTGLEPAYVRQCCNGYVNKATGFKRRLPEGWQARKVGGPSKFRTRWVITQVHQKNLASAKPPSGTLEQMRADMIWLSLLENPELIDAADSGELSDGQEKALGRLAALLLRMQSDEEIARLIITRWKFGTKVSGVADFDKCVDPSAPGIIPAVGRSGVPGFDSRFKKLEQLLERMAECYRLAVNNDKPIKVELEFKPDGGWAFHGIDYDAPFLSHTTDVGGIKASENSILGDTLPDLFFSTWFFLLQHVTQHGKWDQSYISSVWIDVPYVQAHPHRAEFLQRCVYCGDYHNKTRRNARCCGVNCRSGLSDFINGMVGQSDDEVTRRLSKRLEYIQSKWRKKVRLQLVENPPELPG